jgi:hypothetical protein
MEVTSGPTECGYENYSRCFEVEIKEVYKQVEGTAKVTKVMTGMSSASCGVYLTVGEQILVSGQPQEDGTFHLNLCGFMRRVTGQSDVAKAEQDAEFMAISCQ